MKRMLSISAFVFGVACAQTTARADVAPERDSGDRATEFRAVTGPQKDNISGGGLMLGAYAIVWTMMFGYVVRLGMLNAATNVRVAELEKALSRTKGS